MKPIQSKGFIIHHIATSAFTAVLLLTPLVAGTPSEAPSNSEFAGNRVTQVANPDDNPIDKAFAEDFANAGASAEINFVAEAYLNAWKAELQIVAGKVKKLYTNKDDAERMTVYLTTYEKLADAAFDLEILNWIDDTTKPVSERLVGTGGLGAAMLAQARIYQQATLNLIAHLHTSDPEVQYVFSYHGNGADLDALRKRNGTADVNQQ